MLVVTVPTEVFRLKPYLLAGSGALIFQPTNNRGGFVPDTDYRAKAVFVYGGGADLGLTKHFALRLEYRRPGIHAPRLRIAGSEFRRNHAHGPTVGRYRLSVLRQRYLWWSSRIPLLPRDSWRAPEKASCAAQKRGLPAARQFVWPKKRVACLRQELTGFNSIFNNKTEISLVKVEIRD